MTFSKSDRTANAELALKLMLDESGDGILYHDFDITVPPYCDQIYPTTWKALEDSVLISVRDVINRPFRALTGRGWLEALRVTGQTMLIKLDDYEEARDSRPSWRRS